MSTVSFRDYALLPSPDELAELYAEPELGGLGKYLTEALKRGGFDELAAPGALRVERPSHWAYSGPDPVPRDVTMPAPQRDSPVDPTRGAWRFDVSNPDLRDALRQFLRVTFANPPIGVSLPFEPTNEHWCPGDATDPMFGDASDAARLIGLDRVVANGAFGKSVNIVVVDDGLDRSRVPGEWGGGWTKIDDPVPPGTPSEAGHGVMVARTVGLAAPRATYFDCRILPPVIGDISAFLEDAQDVYHQMILDIARWRSKGKFTGQWIFVNAWGIYSRLPEDPPGDYTSRWDHPFNLLMSLLSQLGFDTVFAAGNCGQFCPKQRCGPDDRGPGNSILGANSHPRVLTAGAVRADGLWLGYSSQGPGQLDRCKPDLCAPAQFRDESDASALNTGTSAACGVAAGVVAALRGRWGPDVISPAELRTLLRLTARIDEGPRWEDRLGNGILDAACAWGAAEALFPHATLSEAQIGSGAGDHDLA